MTRRKRVSPRARTIGKKIREAREHRHLSQGGLAAQLETNQSTVSRWERGLSLPTFDLREALCKSLRLSPEIFVSSAERESESSDTGEQHFLAYWLMPHEYNPYFLGREQIIEDISTIFLKEDTPSIKICVISGLPGVGKTQVAITYAYRQRNKYQAVFWLRADTYENMMSDFVNIAHVLDLPEKTSTNQMALLHAVKQWLCHHPGWLLIFDNVEHLELIPAFLPPEGSGHVILTQRSEIAGKTATKLEVHPMELEEGAIFLLYRANITQAGALALETVTQQDQEHAKTLSQEMDGLPLALDQAGAYIEELPCSLAEYLALYQKQRSHLLQRRGAMSYGHPASIMATISLTLEKIKAVNSAAVDLLYLFAHLHPDHIQKTILRGDIPDLTFHLQTLASSPALLNEALGLLSKYALIQKVPESSMPVCFRMHRLVQDVLQDLLETGAAKLQWAELTVRVVNCMLSSLSFVDWQRYHDYISHAQTCVTLIEKWNIFSEDAVALLAWVAAYWHEQGEYTKVQPLLEKITSMLAEMKEPNQLALLENMNHLATFYLNQKKYQEAENLYLQVLTALERDNGKLSQVLQATLYNNLGELYDARAEYKKAEDYLARSLALYEQFLGPEHELCAVSHYCLAEFYSKQEEYAQAETHHQRALQIRQQKLAPDHPSLAESLNGMGANFIRQRRYNEAESFLLKALQIRQKAFGRNHWSVAQTLDNLGNACIGLQKPQEAENYFLRALKIREQISTSEERDRDMTDTLIGLGITYLMQGRVSEAKPLFENAAFLRAQTLGPDHPDTLRVFKMIEMVENIQSSFQEKL